jgi:hypothetical protein
MGNDVNRRELRIIGMSRSGNHAIINWIMRQAIGRVCFLNCAEPKTNPFRTARPMADGKRFSTVGCRVSLSQELQGNFSQKDWLLYSHEDCFLGMVVHDDFERNHDRYVGRSAERTDVLILRDPFNLFASRLQAQYSQVTARTAVRIWKQHAREFCGRRPYLPQGRVPISFNDWAVDRQYRRRIAERLGLGFTDAGFEEVSRTGGGSSFDGTAYDGRASGMDVLQRWKHCRQDERYLQLFDRQMVELSEEIFGVIPGTGQLRIR